jgi:hypothetical protein
MSVRDVPQEWVEMAWGAYGTAAVGDMRAALAAVAPLIAKAERERCAVVALDYLNGIEKLTGQQAPGVVEAAAISIAAAIRALDT